jgi:hypothetical protein
MRDSNRSNPATESDGATSDATCDIEPGSLPGVYSATGEIRRWGLTRFGLAEMKHL